MYRSTYDIVRNRELGNRRYLGYDDDIARKVYLNFDRFWLDKESKYWRAVDGGIFNLEYSLDGRLLVAACENRSVLMYDACNQKKIKTVRTAHEKCVNCVRFIDDYSYATCSDDSSIKIWDMRKLKKPRTRILHGHTNWVKNIEYSDRDRMLITSAFDGTVCGWDLTQSTEHNLRPEVLFMMNGLMRTKLSPDGTKLVIATTSGFMIIVHDLHLPTLYSDTRNFKPVFYRLMQLSEQSFPTALTFNSLFSLSRKKNRIEFIDDFPNEAETISSLQIHPMGWSALSRNSSYYDDKEFTCVHDIQTRDPEDYAESFTLVESDPMFHEDDDDEQMDPPESQQSPPPPPQPEQHRTRSESSPSTGGSTTAFTVVVATTEDTHSASVSRSRRAATRPVAIRDVRQPRYSTSQTDIWMGYVRHDMRLVGEMQSDFDMLGSGLRMALSSQSTETEDDQDAATATVAMQDGNHDDNDTADEDEERESADVRPLAASREYSEPGITERLARRWLHSPIVRRLGTYSDDMSPIVKNLPRMTHYIQEPNKGQGFIKELCFSTDGRLVCSPYDKDVRLLSFDRDLRELCYCVPDKPQQLREVTRLRNHHEKVVVCCKFNPRHYELVSGCLGGQIVWYRPRF